MLPARGKTHAHNGRASNRAIYTRKNMWPSNDCHKLISMQLRSMTGCSIQIGATAHACRQRFTKQLISLCSCQRNVSCKMKH